MGDYRAQDDVPEPHATVETHGAERGPSEPLSPLYWRDRCQRAEHQLQGAVDLLEQAVDLIAQPTIPDAARERWQAAVDALLGDAAAGGR